MFCVWICNKVDMATLKMGVLSTIDSRSQEVGQGVELEHVLPQASAYAHTTQVNPLSQQKQYIASRAYKLLMGVYKPLIAYYDAR